MKYHAWLSIEDSIEDDRVEKANRWLKLLNYFTEWRLLNEC